MLPRQRSRRAWEEAPWMCPKPQGPGAEGRCQGKKLETVEMSWGSDQQRLTHRNTDLGRIPIQKGRAQS